MMINMKSEHSIGRNVVEKLNQIHWHCDANSNIFECNAILVYSISIPTQYADVGRLDFKPTKPRLFEQGFARQNGHTEARQVNLPKNVEKYFQTIGINMHGDVRHRSSSLFFAIRKRLTKI